VLLDLQVVDRRGADGFRRDDIIGCLSMHPVLLIYTYISSPMTTTL